MLTFFIGYKVYKVLGDTRYDDIPRSQVQDLDTNTESIEGVIERETFVMQSAPSFEVTPKTQENLELLAKYLDAQESKIFMKKALDAFEYIMTLFAKHEVSGLKHLVSGNALEYFENRIKELQNLNQLEVIAIVAVSGVELKKVYVSEDNLFVEMLFETEQIKYVKKAEASNDEIEVVSGSHTKIIPVKEVWTFSKPLNSKNTTWMLIDV